MTRAPHLADDLQAEPTGIDFDQYVHYDDEDTTVICDRTQATAWIRSTVVCRCER